MDVDDEDTGLLYRTAWAFKVFCAYAINTNVACAGSVISLCMTKPTGNQCAK